MECPIEESVLLLGYADFFEPARALRMLRAHWVSAWDYEPLECLNTMVFIKSKHVFSHRLLSLNWHDLY